MSRFDSKIDNILIKHSVVKGNETPFACALSLGVFSTGGESIGLEDIGFARF